MPWYAYLLAPAAFIFHGITSVRNILFDRGLIRSQKSPIPTLVVGNLSVGGTGKTPFVEFLVRKLRDEVGLGTLSRGYGRNTSGFLQVLAANSPDEVGDEPMQLYNQFKGEIPVFVGENRVAAAQKIEHLRPDLKLLILDDAFQHRKLIPDISIILTPYTSPFSKDYLLPSGRLRESRSGAKRADVVVVTKCPAALSQEEKNKLAEEIAPYLNPTADLFFSSLNYGKPYQVAGPKQTAIEAVIALAGLADDAAFLAHCKQQYAVIETFSFPDHYAYRPEDATQIMKVLGQEEGKNVVLLTTEKDAVKLKSLAATEIWSKIPIFALPIQVALDPSQEEKLLYRLRKNLLHP